MYKHPGSEDRAVEPTATVAGEQLLSVAPANEAGPWDVTASGTWLPIHPGSLKRWERLLQFSTHLEGRIVAGRLVAEAIPARVEIVPPGVDFVAMSAVWVPAEAARRAQWVLAWDPPPEEELASLALSTP